MAAPFLLFLKILENMQAAINYPWAKELEKTVVNSLTTTFGLDFLLFKDKVGGDVDTIQNVRKNIYATDASRQKYEQRGDYDSTAYHSHKNFIETGRREKAAHQSGNLHDAYRNQSMGLNEKRDLDHVIAAKEIHDDRGRVLAGLDGAELANQSSNLQSTHFSINRSKKATCCDDFLNELPGKIEIYENNLKKDQERLAALPRVTPEQIHKVNELEAKIRKDKNKIDALKSVDAEEMRKKDEEARDKYDSEINRKYYGGSKFVVSAASAAGISGLKMGTRQMLGLIMAEIWFELRDQIPEILENLKQKFSFDKFIEHIKNTLQGIWHRVQKRFNDFLMAFKEGAFAGVMSSVTTTIFNIFATTQKMAIKIIREIWGQLVKAFKLIFFNPDQLGFVDLCRAVVGILSAAAGVAVGSLVHAQLVPILSFPFGAELAAFAGALVTGLITLGFTYFLLHSEMAKKMWDFAESIMPHAGTVKKYQAINAELDRYLTELTRIEFNLDPEELAVFSRDLASCTDEMQRGLVIKEEITRRGIELPYEIGNPASTRKWLASLVK